MTITETITSLRSNRLLKTQEQVSAFDEALARVSQHPDASKHLLELHLVLDDQTQQAEVMYGLVHLLESFGIEEQLQAFFQALPSLLKQAPEWVKTLNYRLLNDEEARNAYKASFRSASEETRKLIRMLLKELIAEEPPPLRDYAQDVIGLP